MRKSSQADEWPASVRGSLVGVERVRRLSSSESAASAVNTFKRLHAGLHNEAAGVTAWRGEGKKKKVNLC